MARKISYGKPCFQTYQNTQSSLKSGLVFDANFEHPTLEGICDAAFQGCNSLKSIYALNPQGIGIKGKPFEEYTQSQCTLYVPEGSMYNYKCWEEWNAFNHIVEFSPTGINGVHSAAERREVERYDTSGRRLTSPTKGLNIVRFNDGTTRKVMK